MASCNGDGNFDLIIESVGSYGPFQKRFNIIFVGFLTLFIVPPYYNTYLILSLPNHNCKAPELMNITAEEWKENYIPRVFDVNGETALSKCKMYEDVIVSGNKTKRYKVDCQNGWEFDTTWYKSTVATQEEWVCDKMWNIPNSIMAGKLGNIFGNLVYGQLCDIIGRKPSFLILMFIFVIGKMLIIFTSHWTYLFYALMFIGSSPAVTLYQLPMVVATEMSKPENRAGVVLMHGIGWSVGFCMMPLIMWAIGDWVYYMIIITAPCAVFILLYGLWPESSRWLAMKGKVDECIKTLEKIAKTNNKTLPEDTAAILSKVSSPKRTMGVLSLFSNRRLATNTVILTLQMTTSSYLFNMLALNINSISVNPFLNLFFQGIIEFPGYKCGEIFSNLIGRKWVNVASFTLCLLGCVPIYFMLHDTRFDIWIFVICIFLKFCISVSYFAVQLMTLEIYPTCSRQTGFSMQSFSGSVFVILVPYVVQLAMKDDNKHLPYISMGAFALIAAACGTLLPETIDKKLPETLDETVDFGSDQNFWGRAKIQNK